MSSPVLRSLSLLLGIFFIFVGTVKLTSYVSKDLHKDSRKEFIKYAKVFPLSDVFEFKVSAKWYRVIVGCVEVICGFVLAFVQKCQVKYTANIVLIMLMMLIVYSHYMVNDELLKIFPALVFFIMLCGCLVINWQVSNQVTKHIVNGQGSTQQNPVVNAWKQK